MLCHGVRMDRNKYVENYDNRRNLCFNYYSNLSKNSAQEYNRDDNSV